MWFLCVTLTQPMPRVQKSALSWAGVSPWAGKQARGLHLQGCAALTYNRIWAEHGQGYDHESQLLGWIENWIVDILCKLSHLLFMGLKEKHNRHHIDNENEAMKMSVPPLKPPWEQSAGQNPDQEMARSELSMQGNHHVLRKDFIFLHYTFSPPSQKGSGRRQN